MSEKKLEKVKALLLTEEELALVRCAIVNCDLLWERKGAHWIPKDDVTANVLEKIRQVEEEFQGAGQGKQRAPSAEQNTRRSSKITKDDWETPEWLMVHFKKHFDPCPAQASFDGLKIDWENPSYVNPPYSKPAEWVEKAIEQARKGVNVVMLLRVDPSTKWYRRLIEEDAYIAFFNKRIRFKGAKGSPNFASMLVFLPAKRRQQE